MENLDIRDFPTVSTVQLYDYVLLTLFDGSAAKMTASLLRSVLTRGITPSISEDGQWYIGETATGVTAIGKTPEFRKGSNSIEYKYTTEDSTMWRTFVLYSDLRINYDDLTEEQRDELRLKYSDLTEEEIAELQKPAQDTIDLLTATDTAVKEAEALRVEAEEARVKAESARVEEEEARATAEEKRAEAEETRATAETTRVDAEDARATAEAARVKAESARVKAEDARAKAEDTRVTNEDARIASETARTTAETARATAETARAKAETSRATAEEARVTAETDRATNEDTRIDNEDTRIDNEDERIASEKARATAETARATAETTRSTAETSRVDAEAARVKAESERTKAEESRVTAENTRTANENTRIASEKTRETSEASRVSAEQSRVEAEQARAEAESARVEAEQQRSEDYATLRTDIIDATADARDAAGDARQYPIIKDGNWWIWDGDAYVDSGSTALGKQPIIQNGTWWLWDDDADRYYDTGQSVNTDYQLTKAKIEGVFTGNITTHTHDQYAVATEVEQSLAKKQDVITDLETIRSGANLGSTALQSVPGEYVTESELTAKGYAIKTEVTEGLSKKQDAIADLETIRSGAALGATALQSVPDEYVTDSELAVELNKKQDIISDLADIRSGATLGKTALQAVPDEYVTEDELKQKGYATTSEVTEGLGKKQDKNLYFTNLTASTWVADATYPDFPYRCDLPCPGVTASHFAEVVFSIPEATSGDYAPICETKTDAVSIWSELTIEVTIPTVMVHL